MSVRRIVKHLPFAAVVASTVALLGACGEPLAADEDGVDSGDTITALETPPPAATMSCTHNRDTTVITCTGGASNGVSPYTYQWQMAYDLAADPSPENWPWDNGTTTYTEWCTTGLQQGGRFFYLYIRFRVLDANNYVSNYVEKRYQCWTPNP